MQRKYDNMTPDPDPELCDVCGKCWSREEGFLLADGRIVCQECHNKIKTVER